MSLAPHLHQGVLFKLAHEAVYRADAGAWVVLACLDEQRDRIYGVLLRHQGGQYGAPGCGHLQTGRLAALLPAIKVGAIHGVAR